MHLIPHSRFVAVEPQSLPGHWECDLADDSLRWSPDVYDIFGIPRGARLDRGAIVRMYAEESRTMLDQLRAQAIAQRGSFTFEARIVRADGASRWIRIAADVVCRDGCATHLYGLKQDITAEIGG